MQLRPNEGKRVSGNYCSNIHNIDGGWSITLHISPEEKEAPSSYVSGLQHPENKWRSQDLNPDVPHQWLGT